MVKSIKKDSKRYTKRHLIGDVSELALTAAQRGYTLGPTDTFALGYLAGKYGLKRLLRKQEEVIIACQEYDKTDDLGLLDTIGETLIDLDAIVNDGRL